MRRRFVHHCHVAKPTPPLRAVSARRRRGSVLVLVMTLLGVLFVTGVAFLATMSFEAELIDAQQQRDLGRVGAGSVVDDVGSILREAMLAGPGVPFGQGAIGDAITSFSELPGVHNLSAPIEPRLITTTLGDRWVFEWITDPRPIRDGDADTEPDGSMFRGLIGGQDFATGLRVTGLDTGWLPGVPVVIDGVDPRILTLVLDRDPTKPNDSILPVDADGDGISDSLAFPLSDRPIDTLADGINDTLVFSPAQIEALKARLNTPTNRDGQVYLGLRVIPHGGLVNVNESHPSLIANVFDMGVDDLASSAMANADYGFFRHRPSSDCGPDDCTKYAPAVEEPLLRRRGLLPPKEMSPSLLQGNPLLAAVGRGAPGDADMWMLFPPVEGGEFESVYTDAHRYAPFRYAPNDPANWDADADAPVWAVRMEPFTAEGAARPTDAYDKRHLVTTVSHDDLLSRGADWQGRDMVELMREINRTVDLSMGCPAVLPFEYVDYPQDLPNETIPNFEGEVCECPAQDVCEFDPRKGRLQLSLAWLDRVFDCASITDPVVFQNCEARRNRLIYDAFLMLVNNARGPYWDWDAYDCSLAGNQCPGGSFCDPLKQRCIDTATGQNLRYARISRTAASLTANLIDYMDLECQGGAKDGMGCRTNDDCPGGGVCGDLGIPTRIALRSADFSESRCVGGGNPGADCSANPANCTGGGECLPTAGFEFGSERIPRVPPPQLGEDPRQYVYGLERQPFITEVATIAATGGLVTGWAVEIFNPYAADIPGTDYWLVEVDPAAGYGSANWIAVSEPLAAGELTVFQSTFGLPVGPTGVGRVHALPGPEMLSFQAEWIVYLVRRATYPGGVTRDIVVDQFYVNGPEIGRPDPDGTGVPNQIRSMPRTVSPSAEWKAPVPVSGFDVPAHSLGNWNGNDPGIRPVEMHFANTGSFTKPHWLDDPEEGDPTNDIRAGIAFPTTGSMLLALRHANRELSSLEYSRSTDLAFTSWLDDTTAAPDPIFPDPTIPVEEKRLVDNGRMPVFDPPAGRCVDVGGATGRTCSQNGDCNTGETCVAVAAAHHLLPRETGLGEPGNADSLPWGQFVFDYFTALPLESEGPYTDESTVGDPDAMPRVDLDGLRVHGRININAAPWKVLAGLPMVTAPQLPRPFARKLSGQVHAICDSGQFAGGWCNTDDHCPPRTGNPSDPKCVQPVCIGGTYAGAPCAGNLDCLGGTCTNYVGIAGREFAQGMVAYREVREGQPTDTINPGPYTGDFGDNPGARGLGRGWSDPNPAYRRGGGFLTVGELANVRHEQAAFVGFRTDGGRSTADNADFVEAVARLVALGDWVTVRSHVYTVYGTLRGDWDPELLGDRPDLDSYLAATPDVDSRALRFQETVDRLPTFLGRPEPVPIGERTMAKYTDVRND